MTRYRIGRAATNEIVLQDSSVSREHAELTKLSRGVFQLRDLGSTYGTSTRQGSDWHLVTAENVAYDTAIRFGEVETTVAELLREVDPLAVYMWPSTQPLWAAAEPRLSPDERARQPETVHVGWGPGEEPAVLFNPRPGRMTGQAATGRPIAVLSVIGAMAIVALVIAVATLG